MNLYLWLNYLIPSFKYQQNVFCKFTKFETQMNPKYKLKPVQKGSRLFLVLLYHFQNKTVWDLIKNNPLGLQKPKPWRGTPRRPKKGRLNIFGSLG